MPISAPVPLKAGNNWAVTVEVLNTGPTPFPLQGFNAAAYLLDSVTPAGASTVASPTTPAVAATLSAKVVPNATTGGLIYVTATPADTENFTKEGIYLLVVQISNPTTQYVREFDPIEVMVSRNLIPTPFAVV